MVEYHDKKSSGVAKAGLATAAAVAGITLLNGNNPLGGIGGGFAGGPARYGNFAPSITFAAEQAALQGGYVTEKEMGLIRENSAQGSVIAQLTAEKYADAAVKTATDPINARICNLETATAVNAARDQDFRAYVNREFVHQPKATMNEMIVTCKPCGCHHGCECSC